MFKNLLKKRNQSGFTIIEVMIVLAIAGLILVVVLIAVPQLQRNQRNSARTADASRVATTIGNIVANNKGAAYVAADEQRLRDDVGSLSQYDNVDATFQAPAVGAGAAISNPSLIVIRTGAKCGTNGAAVAAAGRSFVVQYATEDSDSTATTNGSGQCIES